MASIFSKIVAGEIPSHKILEDENYYSFLDIRPINLGHTLVITKFEEDYIFDLPESIMAGLLPFAKRIVPAIEKVVSCKRVGIMVAGLEVPHAHIHLIPMIHEGDLSFANAKPGEPEELKTLAEKITSHL